MSWYFICSTHALSTGSIKSFNIELQGKDTLELLIFQHDNLTYAYKNSCPHLGIPLNWQPDTFLSRDNAHIQCSTHGALFTFEKGHCILGPCAGDALTPLTIEQRDNEVWLHHP